MALNLNVLRLPREARSKPRAKGQMSAVVKGDVSCFTTRFEKNPIHSPSGTVLASEIYFLLRAEPRMQVRMTWLLWNLHLQGAEGRNLYNHKKIVQIPRQECRSRIWFYSLIFIFQYVCGLFGFFFQGERTFKDKKGFRMIRISRSYITIVTPVALVRLVCSPVHFIQCGMVITNEERTLRLLRSQLRQNSPFR